MILFKNLAPRCVLLLTNLWFRRMSKILADKIFACHSKSKQSGHNDMTVPYYQEYFFVDVSLLYQSA